MESKVSRVNGHRVLAAGLALAAGLGAAPALGQSGQPPFEIWLVQASPNPEWRNAIRSDDLPYSTNAQIIPEHLLGNYPIAGPHMMELAPGGRAEFIRQHIERVRQDVQAWFADPNYDGHAIIDYEAWYPYWTTHFNFPSTEGREAWDSDPLDDWRDVIRQTRPQLLSGLNAQQQEAVFRTTWLEATREFWEATLQECKNVRPHAKWGIYSLPPRSYYAWFSQADSDAIRWVDDNELAWLWQRVDAIYPSIYTFYYSIDGRTLRDGEDRPESSATYIRGMVDEAVRIADGKPVIPVLWCVYHNSNRNYALQLVNDVNMRQMFEIPLECGADGFVVWDWITSAPYYNALRGFANDRLNPFLRNLVLQYTPPAPPPPDPGGGDDNGQQPGGGSPGGGSGGGSPGGGGGSSPPPAPPQDPGNGQQPPAGGGGGGGGSSGGGGSAGGGSAGGGGSGGGGSPGGGGSSPGDGGGSNPQDLIGGSGSSGGSASGGSSSGGGSSGGGSAGGGGQVIGSGGDPVWLRARVERPGFTAASNPRSARVQLGSSSGPRIRVDQGGGNSGGSGAGNSNPGAGNAQQPNRRVSSPHTNTPQSGSLPEWVRQRREREPDPE